MCVKTKGDEFMRCALRGMRGLIFQAVTDDAMRNLCAKNDPKCGVANAMPRIVTGLVLGGVPGNAREVALEGHSPL
jgi:hypothetical protein